MIASLKVSLQVVVPPLIWAGLLLCHPDQVEALLPGALFILPSGPVRTTPTITDSSCLSIHTGDTNKHEFRAHIRIGLDFSRPTLKKRTLSCTN